MAIGWGTGNKIWEGSRLVNSHRGISTTEGYKYMVLIVNHDRSFRKLLYTLFKNGGGFHSCVEARNGVEAIAKTKQLLPCLAILDSSMPEMNGFELARELKAISPELPIFMMTDENDLEVEKEALSGGITAVFSKLDDLSSLVANARAVCGIE